MVSPAGRCAECGHVGCCDSSPSQHASHHVEQSGHPVVQSFEPGEDWFFDYRTGQFADGPTLAEPTHHPVDQPAPGPRGRVPVDSAAPPALTASCACRSREARDQPSGRPTQNGVAFAVVELSGVWKLT